MALICGRRQVVLTPSGLVWRSGSAGTSGFGTGGALGKDGDARPPHRSEAQAGNQP